ncbi:hypothetical protein FNV43_RR11644 [Rhamnella rubrinervis]|uniref:Uncharacterized protein n=1 Tax=Rhamnella rubrinervis TaxID=2594499 RepID=A0A8K0MI24_9ROSA|nr:hypothetical protein FNV43_RR11644 [Rhamnella rubrinervis]
MATEFSEFRLDTMQEAFEFMRKQYHPGHHDTHMHDATEDVAMRDEGGAPNLNMNMVDNDSEIQYATPSKMSLKSFITTTTLSPKSLPTYQPISVYAFSTRMPMFTLFRISLNLWYDAVNYLKYLDTLRVFESFKSVWIFAESTYKIFEHVKKRVYCFVKSDGMKWSGSSKSSMGKKRKLNGCGLPLKVVSYKDLYGWIVKMIGLKNNYTFYGVFRHQV